MKNVFNWFAECPDIVRSKPWLVLGKGPSFSRWREIALHDYNVLTLNHAIRGIESCPYVTVAHTIDFDVIGQLSKDVVHKPHHWLMPCRPHFRRTWSGNVAPLSLRKLVADTDELRRVLGPDHEPARARVTEIERTCEDRLLYYALYPMLDDDFDDLCPSVPAGFSSAETVIRLLAMAGVRTIRTLGVDGGSSRDSYFKKEELGGLDGRVTHESLDPQWAGIVHTVNEFKLDFQKL